MVEVQKSEIVGEPTFVPVVEKGIHGGIIKESNLPHDEKEYCKRCPWIERCVQFYCNRCKLHHETSPQNVICTAAQVEVRVSDSNLTRGYRLTSDFELPEPIKNEYDVYLIDNENNINLGKVSEKSIFFTPEARKISLHDSVGWAIVAPLNRLPELYSDHQYEAFIDQIRTLVSREIDWEQLDESGEMFQKITHRLLRENEDFHNVSPGGTGADQAKDGFCYKESGRRELKIMVQVKFNNHGSGLNADDIKSMSFDAESHDCLGLLVTTIKTTGDLETKLGKSKFVSNMYFLDVWAEEEMRDLVAQHPAILEDYFIN